jgi:hypothetical protein
MKVLLTLYIILFTVASCGNNKVEKEVLIKTPLEAQTWCKNKSIKYFAEKNKTPQGWTASWRNEGENIDIKGTWKVDGIEYIVQCRIKEGLTEKMAVITIKENKNTPAK